MITSYLFLLLFAIALTVLVIFRESLFWKFHVLKLTIAGAKETYNKMDILKRVIPTTICLGAIFLNLPSILANLIYHYLCTEQTELIRLFRLLHFPIREALLTIFLVGIVALSITVLVGDLKKWCVQERRSCGHYPILTLEPETSTNIYEVILPYI